MIIDLTGHMTTNCQWATGVPVPGNRDITPLAQAARIAEFHAPYHAAVEDALAASLQQRKSHADLLPALISMHSFTPVMDGFKRPWYIGILWGRDERLPLPLMESFRQRGIAVGDNEPYSGRDARGYTLRRNGEPRSRPNVPVEVRQDLIGTPKGVAKWVKVLGEARFQYWRAGSVARQPSGTPIGRRQMKVTDTIARSASDLESRTPWGYL